MMETRNRFAVLMGLILSIPLARDCKLGKTLAWTLSKLVAIYNFCSDALYMVKNESPGNIPIGLLNIFQPGRYEVQASCTFTTEAPLDIGHELPPDVLEAVDTQSAVLAGLAGDVPLTGVGTAEHGEHDVVLGSDPEVCREVGARFPHVGRLEGIFYENKHLHFAHNFILISIIIEGHHNLKRRFMN